MTVKKRHPGLIVTLVLLLLLAALAAAVYFFVPRAGAPEEISAILSERRFSSAPVPILCSDACYRRVSTDQAALTRVTVMGGVKNVKERFFPFLRLIYFTDFAPDDTPWADCSDTAAMRHAARRFAEDGVSAFTLLAPKASVVDLGDGASILPYLAMGGVLDEPSIVCDPERGTVRVSDLTYTDEPYAAVEDIDGFAAAVDSFREKGLSAFTLVLEPEYYGSYAYDGQTKLLSQAASCLSFYESELDGTRCTVRFSEAAYTDAARFVCRTEDDIVSAVASVASEGGTEFELFLPDHFLFDSLSADDFALLYELEQRGGLVMSDLSYNDEGTRLIYKNATLVSDAVHLETVSDAAAYLNQKAAELSDSIYLFCSPEVYASLTQELFSDTGSIKLARIQDLLPQAGIFDSAIGVVRNVVYVRVDQYFPGTRIVRAVETGTEESLTERERLTLDGAREISAACIDDDPRETALAIHDALCERIVYTDDPDTDEDDTAVGAILSGKANCDGYADAFYLIGTLSGLSVRYQHGDTYDVMRERDERDTTTHLWNLLELDGAWRTVDVTYDDEDDHDAPCRAWFDIGVDRASRTHEWHVPAAEPLLESTDLSARPDNELTVSTRAELSAAIDRGVSSGWSTWRIIYDDDGLAAGYNGALDEISARYGYDFWYSWNADMRMLSIYAG